MPVLAVVVLGCAACEQTTSSPTSVKAPPASTALPSATPATRKLDAAVTRPTGFPADFPVYPGARLTAASQVLANSQTTWGVEWETLDGADAVRAFYEDKLSEGDWSVTYNGSTKAGYSAIISRRSNQKDAGILTVEPEAGVTHIALALGIPG